jgi:hypothetical protein
MACLEEHLASMLNWLVTRHNIFYLIDYLSAFFLVHLKQISSPEAK